MNKSYFKKIDSLRKKFNNNKPLTLRETCWILWAEELVYSTKYRTFAYWVGKNKLPKSQKMTWSIWKSLFTSFAKDYYPTVENDYDLIAKVRQMDVDILMGEK